MIIVMKVGTPEAEIERVSSDLATSWNVHPEKNCRATQSGDWVSGGNR
jgi:hypothetical protein